MNTKRLHGIAAALTWLAAGLATHAGTTGVIVQLNEEPAARWFARAQQSGSSPTEQALAAERARLAAGHDAFLAELGRQGIAHTVGTVTVTGFDGTQTSFRQSWTLVFNGLALDVAPEAIARIAALPQVESVRPDRALPLTLDKSVAYVRAPGLYGGVAELGAGDDLREGYEGYGIRIAVIDSGIDWSHDMFGGDPTPPRLGIAPDAAAANFNRKVIYYLPLAGVADDFGHGTHVAATTAGYLAYAPGADGLPLTADDVAVHGVAPQAKLMGYKACNAAGTCLTSDTLTALEDAVSPRTLNGLPKPTAHVINLSLGGSGGPDDDSAVGADNAVLLGAVVVAAAGNDGPGDGTLGSPAAGRRVIAVAASNDPGVYPSRIDVLTNDGSAVRPGSNPMRGTLAPDSNAGQPMAQPLTGRYVFAGIADTPDKVPVTVLGNICLVERGSTVEAADNGTGLFANKATQCAVKGATGVVVFNDVPGEIGAVLAPAAIPVFTISREDGLVLRDQIGFDATGVSQAPIRLGLPDAALFEEGIAGFSSRGPVAGLGQVKPDVAAPGVDVLAATSAIGAPAVSMQDATRYISVNGTSMATPHVAGAVALLRQARPTWSADVIRSVLINTATNPRSAAGVPAPDGAATDRILDQGGGLVDVTRAAGAKALLGVLGDGIAAPSILASHSFGRVPVVDSRVTHVSKVTAALVDLGGGSGSWSLAVVDNRGLAVPGVSAKVHPKTLSLAAGSQAAFSLEISIDGNRVREAPGPLQGFVVATRGADKLRMPFYLEPVRSIPVQAAGEQTEVTEGLVLAGDTGAEAAEDVTFVDVPLEAHPAAFETAALLEFLTAPGGVPDLDLRLLDPDGLELARSATEGGPEQLEAPIVVLGTYTLRVVGWAAGPTPFTLTTTQTLGGGPPAMQPPTQTEWVSASGVPYDFDGSFTLRWTPVGGESAFEIERSSDGQDWTFVRRLGSSAKGLVLDAQPEGLAYFRLRSLYPGQIGYFVSAPSAVQTVIVDKRQRADITSRTASSISAVAFDGSVFQLDLAITNQSNETYWPIAVLSIEKIQSASGSVAVIGADVGGSGRSVPDAAHFDYSRQLGADELFGAGETTAPRTLRFHDPAAELFTFRARVTAFKQQGLTPPSGSPAASGAALEEPQTTSDPLQALTLLLEVTCNPLTRSTSVRLVDVAGLLP